MPLRICILETDHIHPALIDPFIGYGAMFNALFERQSVPAELEVFNVVEGYYPEAAAHYDAYLVTGSKADSFGDDPWIETLRGFLLERYQRGDKLLGVCFGHQLLALLLGGKAQRAEQGWGVGSHRYTLAEQATWMAPQAEDLTLLISHQDQVTALPEGATVVASSAFCPYAAYRINDQVLCFQGHPEFEQAYFRALLELRQQRFSEQVYQAAVDSLAHDHDGALVAEWMMRFVAGPDRAPA